MMFFITNPSAIRFHSNLAIYCYNCPQCKLRLTKRVRSGKLLKMFSYLFPLKKYVCGECHKRYYVHVKTYSTKTMPGELKYGLDILENSLSARRSKAGTIRAKLFLLGSIFYDFYINVNKKLVHSELPG